jgi:hypothetical protein
MEAPPKSNGERDILSSSTSTPQLRAGELLGRDSWVRLVSLPPGLDARGGSAITGSCRIDPLTLASDVVYVLGWLYLGGGLRELVVGKPTDRAAAVSQELAAFEGMYEILKDNLQPGSYEAQLLEVVERVGSRYSAVLAQLARRLAEFLEEHPDVATELEGLVAQVKGSSAVLAAGSKRLIFHDDYDHHIVSSISDRAALGALLARERGIFDDLWPASRAINTLLYTGGAPVGRDQPLNPAGEYELLVNLGPYDQHSLVMDPLAALLDTALLPPTTTGHWVDVVVSSGDVILDDRRRRALFLPLQGSSWTCVCTPGGPHGCAERERDPYVRVPLRMPERSGVAAVEVAIYYGAAVVHAQALTLPVGVPGTPGPFAKVTYSLTRSFATLGEFAERSMSVLLDTDHGGNHRMYVNGVRLAPFTFNLSDAAAFNAMSRARDLLFRTHLYQEDGEWYSRYSSERQAKPDDDYEKDLRGLAAAGAGLFAALFPDPDESRALQQMLTHEADARGRPPVVQLARSTQSQPIVPWQLVYDLDVGSDPARYQPCPSVLEWGPRRPAGTEIPSRCPHWERHGDEPLCPFGFWGFAYVLEVPPSVKTELAHVVTEDDSQIAIVVAANRTLDVLETVRHLEVLEGLGGVEMPPLTRVLALQDRLSKSDMDVVYLYCHGGRDQPAGATAADAVLELGPGHDDRFKPLDVSMWARSKWAGDHWRSRRPVIVLNGCHTTEILPDTLADFVVGFVAARAAGVIGTEVSLDQRFAGAAMELFLAALHAGASVGQAIRQMRWELLGRGNVMGLAYSPYCAATLALRRAGRLQPA